MKKFSTARVLIFLVSALMSVSARAAQIAEDGAVDFRYAPCWWQTSICLPDDWQKTLVKKDGRLLYDYQKPSGFRTSVSWGMSGDTQWLKQELVSPRIPIVQTWSRAGEIELFQQTFAVPSENRAAKKVEFLIERMDAEKKSQRNWASPGVQFDPVFRDIAVGWNEPVRYRFKAKGGQRYNVVFGLCEGHHQQPGQRILDLQLEGKTRRTVDLVGERGRNVPQVYPFEINDETGDGWIDIAVSASAKSPDSNSILNALWIFPQGKESPSADGLMLGRPVEGMLARAACGDDLETANLPPRNDIALAQFANRGTTKLTCSPTLSIRSESPAVLSPDSRSLLIGTGTKLSFTEPFVSHERVDNDRKLILHFAKTTLKPGAVRKLAFGAGRGACAPELPRSVAEAESLRTKAERYWSKLNFPYDKLQVPDKNIQALLDSCIRNIYQAREIKKGLPAFQVGPTCYRGLWVVDGSFLLEAMTYLERADETRNGIHYLMTFQRDDGSFMLINGHWKETGIVLWAVTRHAQLTGDKAWLEQLWPKLEKGFAYIHTMRGMASAGAPNENLIPDGYSDGGLSGKVPEYTNIYWTLAGMRAAIDAAKWLGHTEQAQQWQKEYDDFLGQFRRAADRDMRSDSNGNRYLPIRMNFDPNISPQKAQWAFLHAVFPGKVFASNDPLVTGNMAMLRSVEKQGLVQDTGWLKDGIWTYFAGFYGNAWLWLGDGKKASEVLYAFANHASPLLVWREEQELVGRGEQMIGDMPHNWASAEFIRLTRHALALERGNELHLFEGMPPTWARPGAVTKMRDVLTEFGPLSLEFRVSSDGKNGTLQVDVPQRSRPEKVVLHLDNWSGRAGVITLAPGKKVKQTIELN